MKIFWSIYRLLKNVNVLQGRTGENSTTPLYSETRKSEDFLNELNVKITKREHASKGYASTYNVEILSSFNPERLKIQLKDTEFAIKNKRKKYCLN